MRFIFAAVCLFCVSISLVGFGGVCAAQMQDYPIVKLQALDKSTARTKTLQARVGETVEYGSLFIKAQSCRESAPLEKPESAAFLQVWEVPILAKKSEWIFSGWMFASSPALSAMDHPVYDVWVLDCLAEGEANGQQKPKSVTKSISVDQEELQEAEEEIDSVTTQEEASDITVQELPEYQSGQDEVDDVLERVLTQE